MLEVVLTTTVNPLILVYLINLDFNVIKTKHFFLDPWNACETEHVGSITL